MRRRRLGDAKLSRSAKGAYVFREAAEFALVLIGLAVASRFLPVPRWAWIALPVGKALFSLVAYRFLLKPSFEQEHWIGSDALIGQVGIALTPLRPSGQVRIWEGIWTARTLGSESIASGEAVRVVGVRGTVVEVESAREP